VYAVVVALVVVAMFLPSNLSAQSGQVIPNSPGAGDVTVKLGAATSAAEFFVFDSADLPLMRVQGDGLVGIGTFTPQDKLHIQDGRLALTSGSSFGLAFLSHPTTRGGFIQTKAVSDYNTALTILDTGIGLGTTTPAYKLHVKPAHNVNIGMFGPASGIGAITFFNEGNTAPIEGRLMAANLTMYANGVERMRVAGSGHVGIGTTAPNVSSFTNSAVLTISSATGSTGRGVLEVGTDLDAGSQTAGAISFFNRSANAGRRESAAIQARADATGTALDRGYSLVFLTKSDSGVATEKVRINAAGNVGIGTATPTEALDVVGNARFSGNVTGANIQAHYQDLAEWVPAAENLDPGSVVVLDPAVSNQVMASSAPYDTTVAGVVSLQPGIILGVGGESKEQIATTGRVKVRVDATAAPIRIGDLLVTSGKRGMAMRSSVIDVGGIGIHRPGTVIGKALEPLDGGEGEILVLLSLQ
jgi:hypothetical protein